MKLELNNWFVNGTIYFLEDPPQCFLQEIEEAHRSAKARVGATSYLLLPRHEVETHKPLEPPYWWNPTLISSILSSQIGDYFLHMPLAMVVALAIMAVLVALYVRAVKSVFP